MGLARPTVALASACVLGRRGRGLSERGCYGSVGMLGLGVQSAKVCDRDSTAFVLRIGHHCLRTNSFDLLLPAFIARDRPLYGSWVPDHSLVGYSVAPMSYNY